MKSDNAQSPKSEQKTVFYTDKVVSPKIYYTLSLQY